MSIINNLGASLVSAVSGDNSDLVTFTPDALASFNASASSTAIDPAVADALLAGATASTINPDLILGTHSPGPYINPWAGVNPDTGVERVQEFSLGTPQRPWGAIYTEEGVITTSDRNAKAFIADSTLGLDFVMRLRPVSFSLREKSTSAKTYGFIGQEVEEALKGKSFHGLKKDDGAYALRYMDFIAPMAKAIQQQQSRIEELEKKLNQLTLALESMKAS